MGATIAVPFWLLLTLICVAGFAIGYVGIDLINMWWEGR